MLFHTSSQETVPGKRRKGFEAIKGDEIKVNVEVNREVINGFTTMWTWWYSGRSLMNGMTHYQ